MTKNLRFSAVISHPIQHYSPVFSELAARPGVDVKIFYLTDHGVTNSFDEGFGTSFCWDVPLTKGHDHKFMLPGYKPARRGFFEMDCRDIEADLSEFEPDIVWIHGYAYRFCWRALRWAGRNHSKSLFFGDSELLHHRNLAARLIKEPLLRYFFSRCDAFLTIGDNNEEYYRHYGVPREKLNRAACPVDIERFTVEDETGKAWREKLRHQFGIASTAVIILFSGKLQAYKRPVDLVEALGVCDNSDIHLMFIGDGPQRQEIVARAEQLNLTAQVHMTGFINQSEMPQYLAAGDIMAVTSERDAHPLVVTEALPYGMPIIASDKIGCVGPTDTARPGENAVVYRCGNVEELAGSINQLVLSPGMLEQYGRASRSVAPTQDIGVTVDAVLRFADES